MCDIWGILFIFIHQNVISSCLGLSRLRFIQNLIVSQLLFTLVHMCLDDVSLSHRIYDIHAFHRNDVDTIMLNEEL